MLKKIFVFLIFLFISIAAYSQHLTRVCVVDLEKVYREFMPLSRAVIQFENRTNRVKAEVDRRQLEIAKVTSDLSEAQLNNNQNDINRLELQLNRLRESLLNYYQAQTTILEDERKRLLQSDSIMSQVTEEIALIAEREGYSVVMEKGKDGIVWFSPTVDITERVIQALQARAAR